jgi:hypothetical protein
MKKLVERLNTLKYSKEAIIKAVGELSCW